MDPTQTLHTKERCYQNSPQSGSCPDCEAQQRSSSISRSSAAIDCREFLSEEIVIAKERISVEVAVSAIVRREYLKKM
ncbi:uncharacterized protein PGTG_20959 [Puccinia graminis f. sp. tritici CRL 75-36-700-3]|uniref:Uncharacterized protein n=1 Tax=Puccinia graminis f. sp. tritici (strain CRL 75-36-700-3 / race SCCL) TaxID=418459 RepID=H6QQ13_PUCGT|nr:uncharacterized protein PGTG_20959 [Puccinia graminis f. sp. tritici CRL 75-36-700-3]EHS64496.1 hypothetical protein PGTG_20959 [Puccinia graminis f. sp. tritici CRL 75-36-700-3]